MSEEIKIETVEEQPKPKRTRRKPKAVEPVVEQVVEAPEMVEEPEPEPETAPEAPIINSKGASDEKVNKYTGKVIASLLNVRENPEINAAVLRAVNYNDKLFIVDEIKGWGKLENGGFVMLKFIKKVDD